MLSMRVLACVAMLPALVVAERFFIGGCGLNFDKYVDPVALTQQGMNTFEQFVQGSGMGSVYLWNPNNKEKTYTDMQFGYVGTDLKLSFNTDKGQREVTVGYKYQITPKMQILLESSETDLKGIFSFDDKGFADLYPVYLSPTEIILRGCVGVLLGRVESLYVITNQDLSGLADSCASQRIKELTGWTVEAPPRE